MSEEKQSSPATPQRQRKWNALRLKYSSPVEILRNLDVDDDVRVLVIGDGSTGAYEWVVERAGYVDKHSDVGYGCADIALRDGLIEFYGPPQSLRSETAPTDYRAAAIYFAEELFKLLPYRRTHSLSREVWHEADDTDTEGNRCVAFLIAEGLVENDSEHSTWYRHRDHTKRARPPERMMP